MSAKKSLKKNDNLLQFESKDIEDKFFSDISNSILKSSIEIKLKQSKVNMGLESDFNYVQPQYICFDSDKNKIKFFPVIHYNIAPSLGYFKKIGNSGFTIEKYIELNNEVLEKYFKLF